MNEALYKIKEKKFHVSSQEREMLNRRVKHKSKRCEEEMALTRKQEAIAARENMIEKEMNKILELVIDKTIQRQNFIELVQKATTPYKHVHEGYVTITKGESESACASILSMSAVESVLVNKQKADELSRLEAKRIKLNEKI